MLSSYKIKSHEGVVFTRSRVSSQHHGGSLAWIDKQDSCAVWLHMSFFIRKKWRFGTRVKSGKNGKHQ